MQYLVVLSVVVSMLIGCSGSATAARQPTAARSQPTAVAQVNIVVTQQPTFPGQIRVRGASQVTLALQNNGPSVTSDIQIQFSQPFFDGFILRTAEPTYLRDDLSPGGSRIFRFAELAVGEEQTYTFNVTANKAGEYRFVISTYANGKSIGQFSGRSVILP